MAAAVLLLSASAVSAAAAEPNPPAWPDSVSVFKAGDSPKSITDKVNAVYAKNGGRKDNGQFSPDRFAFLFMPGTYTGDVPVGYYTQVLGLGAVPTDVVFAGDMGVYCEEGDYDIDIGALDTFWRGAENFQTNSKHLWTDTEGMLWSVSQAAPLRRLVIKNNLKLYEYRGGGAAGYASGGFLSDSVVEGLVASGSQQQWLTRNSNIGKWIEGVWNMVFAGVDSFKGIYDTGAPEPHCGQDIKNCISPYVVIDTVPLIAEKPFISADNTTGKFRLHIPTPRRQSKGADVGPDGIWNTVPSVDFSSVYVAVAANDTASTINAKLRSGLHVVMSPGIYNLDAALTLVHRGQVLLGIGLATLIPTTGAPAVSVLGNASGCRVAGLLLQAGTVHSPTLMQWGDAGKTNPPTPTDDAAFGFIHDVNARVGGPKLPSGAQASTTTMVNIDANGVVGDNMWLWRADHVEGGGLVKNGDNPVDHALVVNGADVTMFALACEHTLKDIVKWNGERGASYFFQAELPYDVKTYPYAGYAVAPTVQSHLSHGAGVYHYFRDYKVTVQSAISCPAALEAHFHDALAVFLNGNGTMLHIINDKGAQTAKPAGPGADTAWLCHTTNTSSGSAPGAAGAGVRPEWAAAPPAPPATCAIGGSVPCPHQAGAMCAGTECCGDGSTCPSAPPKFMCCPKPKGYDCTKGDPIPPPPPPPPPPGPPPPPPGPPPGPPGTNQCNPNQNQTKNCNVCAACCKDYIMDGPECDKCVLESCAGPPGPPGPPGPSPPGPPPSPQGHCKIDATVNCPGTKELCSGPQCCRDGSICPSADDDWKGCAHPKKFDCTKALGGGFYGGQ